MGHDGHKSSIYIAGQTGNGHGAICDSTSEQTNLKSNSFTKVNIIITKDNRIIVTKPGSNVNYNSLRKNILLSCQHPQVATIDRVAFDGQKSAEIRADCPF